MRFAVLLLVLSISCRAWCEGKTCPASGNSVPGLQSSAQAALKKSQVQYASSKMGDFCKRNLMLRYLNSKDKPPENCETWPIEKLEAYTDKVFQSEKEEIKNATWQPTLVGTPNSRKLGHDNFLKAGFKSFDDVETYLSKKTDTPPDRVAMTTAIFDGIAAARPTHDMARALEDTTLQTAACLHDAGVLKLPTCLKATKIIEEKMRVSHGQGEDLMAMTNLPLWREVFSTRKYDEGMRIAALKLLARAKSGKMDKGDNIFSDLRTSFAQSGMNASDAEEAAWKTLALIANGGGNTSQRIFALEGATQRSVALASLANSMGYLDLKKSQLGLPLYSYPPNVVTQCDNAKPYHFWMSAYLARELTKEGFSPDDAETATFIAEKGYHLRRELAYANNQNFKPYAILTRDPYDPAQQIVRTDLAFASAGAVFGAESANQSMGRTINVDEAVVNLLDQSTVVPRLSTEETRSLNVVSAYNKWDMIFSPDTALNSVQKQIGK